MILIFYVYNLTFLKCLHKDIDTKIFIIIGFCLTLTYFKTELKQDKHFITLSLLQTFYSSPQKNRFKFFFVELFRYVAFQNSFALCTFSAKSCGKQQRDCWKISVSELSQKFAY